MTDIDTGDTVRHRPTGEEWIVARVKGDKLAWIGWPPGWADLSDCTLVEKATPKYKLITLRDIANSRGHHCKEWAASRLAQEGMSA